jgi:hypothetical protein
MGYAQDLIDEIESEELFWRTKIIKISRGRTTEEEKIEKEVEKTLMESFQQELEGNSSSTCAQQLLNSI